jgi:hypothetical protein
MARLKQDGLWLCVDYVFVDEHYRHKRLKGAAQHTRRVPSGPRQWLTWTAIRACEGCRRHKTKCNMVTTNVWPCATCIRLKLYCVPPTVSYDRDRNANTQAFELETKTLEFAVPDPQKDYRRTVTFNRRPHRCRRCPSLAPMLTACACVKPPLL